MANPCDTEGFKSYIVKNEGAVSGHPGSTFLLSQKFQFNWTVLGEMDKVRPAAFVHGFPLATGTVVVNFDVYKIT